MTYREPEPSPDDTDVLKRGKRRMIGGFAVLAVMLAAPFVGGALSGTNGAVTGGALSLVLLVGALVRFANAPGHGIHGPRD